MEPTCQTSLKINGQEPISPLLDSSLVGVPLTQEIRTQPRSCGIFGSGYMPPGDFETIASDHLDSMRKQNAMCIVPANRLSDVSKVVTEIKKENVKISFYLVDSLAGVLSGCPLLESTPLINAITGIYDKERHTIYLEKVVGAKIATEHGSMMTKDILAITREHQLEHTSGEYVMSLWKRVWRKQEDYELLLRDSQPLLPVKVSAAAQKGAITPKDIQGSLTSRVNNRDLSICALYSKLVDLLNDLGPKSTLVLDAALATPLQYQPTKAQLHVAPALFNLNGDELSAVFRFAKKYQLAQADTINKDKLANDRSFAIELSYDLLTAYPLRTTKTFVTNLQSAFSKFDERFVENNPFLTQLFNSIYLLASDSRFVHDMPTLKSLKLEYVCLGLKSQIKKLTRKETLGDNTIIPSLVEFLEKLSTPAFLARPSRSSTSDITDLKVRIDALIKHLISEQDTKNNPLIDILTKAFQLCTRHKFKPANSTSKTDLLKLTKARYQLIVDRLAETAPEFWKTFSLEKGDFLAMLRPGLADIANQNKGKNPLVIQTSLTEVLKNPSALLEIRAERMRIRAARQNKKTSSKYSPSRFELESLGIDPTSLSIPQAFEPIAQLLQERCPQLGTADKLSPVSACGMQLFAREWIVKCENTLRDSPINMAIRGQENLVLTSAIAFCLGRHEFGNKEYISRFKRDSVFLAHVKAILIEGLFLSPFSLPPYSKCISSEAKNSVKMAQNAWDNSLLALLDSGLIQLGHFTDHNEVHISRVQKIYSQSQSRIRLRREISTIEKKDLLANSPRSSDLDAYLSLVAAQVLPTTAALLRYCNTIVHERGHRLMRAEVSAEKLTVEIQSWRILLQNIVNIISQGGQAQEQRNAIRSALSEVHKLNSVNRQIAAQMFSRYLELGGNDFAPSLVPAWITLLFVEGKLRRGSETPQSALQRLETAPHEYTQDIALRWISTPAKVIKLLKSGLDRNVRSFVLKRCSTELLESALQGVDTDQVRKYFEDFPLLEALRITKNALDPYARRAFIQREVYEASIRELPFMIECLETEEELPNYFAVLGIPRHSSVAVIRKSYRMLALVYHPDLFSQESQDARDNAKERTRQLAEAFEVLVNTELSKNYARAIPNYHSFYPSNPWYQSLPKSKQLEQ